MKFPGITGKNEGLKAGCVVLVALAAVLCLPSLGEASEPAKSYTHPDCDGTKPCGAIVYANKGGYVVKSVHLTSRSTQPDTGASCSGIDVKIGQDLIFGEYHQYVVPASCAYKLKINIAAGPKKDRNLFLTPACVIEAKTDGTTSSNEWHVSYSWIKGKKPDGAPSKPIDAHGHKCGNLSKSGT